MVPSAGDSSEVEPSDIGKNTIFQCATENAFFAPWRSEFSGIDSPSIKFEK